MNIEEKIRIIEEKIANLPQEFDEEETQIINNNQRLKELIKQTILNNLHLCNEEVFSCLSEEVINSLLETDANIIYYHFVENMLKKTVVSTTDLINFLNQTNLTEEQRNHFKEEVKKAFQNKELKIENFNTNQETIKEMLHYGRFDLISQIKNAYLDDDLLEELWNVYPFDQYPFPRFFATTDYLPKKYIEKFPIQEAILVYVRTVINSSFGMEEEKNAARKLLHQYIPVIKEKISKLKNLDLSFLYEDNSYFNNLVPNPRNDKYDAQVTKDMLDIAVKLFHCGLYDIMDELLSHDLISREEAKKAISQVAESGNYKKFEDIRFTNFVEKFKDDLGLATILLENGFIQAASFISFDFVQEKTSYIIEQLNNKNKKFKNYATSLIYDGKGVNEKQFDLYLAMLNSGFVEKIFTGTYNNFTEEEINELKYILYKYPNIPFSSVNMSQEDFLKILDTLLETKRIPSILEYIKSGCFTDCAELIREINKNNVLINVISSNITQGLELLQSSLQVIVEIPELLDEYCKNDIYINRLLDLVNHNENLESFYNVENYNKVKNYLSRQYNIPLENLDKIQEHLGPLIIRYIENENVQALVKLPKEEQDKILALFPKDEYTMQDLRGTYDSLKQYEFSKKHSDEVQIFPILLHAIEDKNNEVIEELIQKLAKELDDTFLKRFLKKYDLPNTYKEDNFIDLVRLVVEKIKISNGEKLDKYQTILHEMTDYYISKKREEYRNTYEMEDELNIPYVLDKKSLENVMIRYIIMYSPNMRTRFPKPKDDTELKEADNFFSSGGLDYYSLYEHLIIRLEQKEIDKQLAKETIDYYINKDKTACRDFKQVQKTIPVLIKIVKEIIDEIPNLHQINYYGINKRILENFIKKADANTEIKRIYIIQDEHNIFEILAQLNIPALQKGVLSNEEVYESLLKTMKKRKLHLIPKCVSNILGTEHINISGDLTNIAGFISYYGLIHGNVKSNLAANGKHSDNILLNITNILIYAEVYSGISSVYSQILGSEDAKLIKANPRPNAASRKLANNGRLREAVERTKKLYERQEITIPPFEEDISLDSGKQMNVVVGNFTNPTNLTHGERTGACMRIGGVGETLFDFALDNPNGFHIRFEDPKTHEYISRVTGFRNGNTVFLNELRDSCNKDKYDNDDVIDACKKAAQRLIELSKNSSCPIENVVVHRAYATSHMKAQMEDLGVENIKEGLPQFYTDIGRSAIVLATTAKQGKFVPLNFDKSNVPTYQPLRERPIITKTLQEASNRINRVNSVKRLLAGENYEYIEPYQFPNGLIYAIVSNDWYIYVDENGNIHKDIIDIDSRAKDELASAFIEVEKNLTQIKSENQEAKYGL